MLRETGVQSQVESHQRHKKKYLMPPCLALSTIRKGSRVEWNNPGNGVAPSQVECSPMVRETKVQSQVESYQRLKKWYLMLPCLVLGTKRWGSKVKWCNPGKGVAPSPTPRCSSYWKGNLLVTLDEGHQQLIYIYIYIRRTAIIERIYKLHNSYNEI